MIVAAVKRFQEQKNLKVSVCVFKVKILEDALIFA